MTTLSPAAQAVMDHFLANVEIGVGHGLSAALRAVAEQVAPEVKSPGGCREGERQCVRRELLAIATELKATS